MDIDKLNDIEISIAEVRALFDFDVQNAVQKLLAYFEFTYVSIPFKYELVTAHELYSDGILRSTLLLTFPTKLLTKDEFEKFMYGVHYIMAGCEIEYAPRYVNVTSEDARFLPHGEHIFAFDFKWHSKSYEFLLNEKRKLYESD
jgi:hypothetical protein